MTQSKTPRGPAHCRGPAIIKNPKRGTKHTRRRLSPHFKPTAAPARGPAQAKAPLQTSKGRHRNRPRQKAKKEERNPRFKTFLKSAAAADFGRIDT